MGYSASGTAAVGEAGPARQQPPGTVRLAGMLTLSLLIHQTGQATVVFAGELDAASADQACGYVRDAIDAHGGQVLLDVAGLSFCDACGLGAFARMSRHAAGPGPACAWWRRRNALRRSSALPAWRTSCRYIPPTRPAKRK